uniref:Fibrinogen C-terminal domain-containing protein n=1 Tax=Amphimedon queenslandica TaxID=400682 RepID=A0A1X7UHS8_AMPQE
MEVKRKYEVVPSDPAQSQENQYEMVPVDTNARRDSVKSTEEVSKQSVWNTPLVVITVLLCLMVFLLVVILCLSLVQLSASCTSTSTATVCSYSEWCDDKVNSHVTGSLPDFDEWANDVVSKVNQTLPDFNQWAKGVISEVNSNVTQSLPNFDQWANGVVSKVNQTLPDFNQWANGVISEVNSNVTQSLPNFDQWANGVVSKVNQTLPDFNQWAKGVISEVNSNVTQSLPNFDQWANGVVSKVNQTLPNFNQWANGVVSKVNQTLPDFNQWANGVAQNTAQLLQNSPNFTELEGQILQTTTDSAQKLINIVNTLSNLEDTSTSTAGVVDDILLIAQEILALHNDSTALPTSCKEIKERQPLSPSGVYLLANTIATYTAYCNMEELCGSGGGWTRLAYLDMSDATQNCPPGFRLYQSGGVRACGRATSNDASCVSVQFPSNSISYSQVCGRVVGYQYASTDAVEHGLWNNPQKHVGGTDPKHNDINSYYVDGVSITRGSPRQHVWTLMAGLSETSTLHFNGIFNCPCSPGSPQNLTLQSFIGNDYFCESGNPATDNSWLYDVYTSDPLWDGKGCGSLEDVCCAAPGIPWFNKVLGTTTTDYLELRVCADQETADEDVPVGFYEIYVK